MADQWPMSDTPYPGDRYQHFKGGTYTVVGLAEHVESGERLVVYRGENNDLWARPYAAWMNSPDGQRRRFTAERQSGADLYEQAKRDLGIDSQGRLHKQPFGHQDRR